jgi:putative aldouronate transport system substrate-binding protein
MSMKSRLLALAALISAFALVAAAGFASGQKATDQAAAGARVKLVFLTNINVDTEGKDVNDNPYLKYIEEKNNVDIEIINETNSNQYNTKVATVMASGDLPDYLQIERTGGKAQLTRWANEGLIIPLDDLLKSTKYLTKDMDPASWDISRINGKIYAVPMQRYDKSPYLIFVRRDFVKNLGIDTTKIKTLDDWHKMLLRFVTDDPDKNGKADTYGIVSRDSTIPGPGVEMFLDSFDATDTRLIDGEVRPWYIQEGYKNWLKFMNTLYKEKVLDPEYVTTTGQQEWEKAKSGKYGSFYWFWSMQEYRSIGGTRDDVLPMPPPNRADGSPAKYLYGGPVRHYIGITKASKNPQKVISILDWAFSDEGGTFVHAGLPGLDYDMVNGQVVIRPDRKGKNWAWRFITLGIQKVKMDDQLQGLLKQSWGDDGVAQLKMSEQLGKYDTVALQAPYFLELAKYDLDTQERTFRNKAIIGQLDIDKEWDNFVATWRKAGGNEWIRLYTEWYKTQKK